MTSLTAGTVPLAVRVRNTRYDGLITGYIHGGIKFQKADPGGFKAASFVVNQKLGYRADIIQPYSRVYFYNTRNGDCVFEGDIAHPGRSTSGDGALLEVQVEGGVERLNDWSGQRIWVDTDKEAWTLTGSATRGAQANNGDDMGGSGADALALAFPNSFHVETNYRAEIGYFRCRESFQFIGYINYRWDGGHTSGSPGWLVRCIADPPSDLIRSQVLNISGSASAGVNLTGVDYQRAYLQLIWTVVQVGGSNTGTADNVWASLMDIVVRSRLYNKDGTWKTSGYGDTIPAADVVNDLLGDPAIMSPTFDQSTATVDAGTGYQITQLAYPDGVTAQQVLDQLMVFEPGCTYLVGASEPGIDKYSFKWMARTNNVRYEFMTWTDEYSGGAQPVDQYDEVVTRWRTSTGYAKTLISTQSIPEMTAMGRTRRFFQNLEDTVSDAANAAQANTTILNDHRFPQNGGSITVARPVVDLYTGRRVQPFDIEPGYLCRIVGINPSRDALNSSPRNGSTLCRIVATDYDADSHSVSISLDSEPWSMFRAIARAKPTKSMPQRKAF